MISDCKKTIELDKTFYKPHYFLGIALAETGKIETDQNTTSIFIGSSNKKF